jgi:3-oxoacyl-[acyl-carrier protein] reductase
MRNQVFVITGTRKGIGKFLAQSYLQQGHDVIGCSRKPGSIVHDNYLHYKLDVADELAVVQTVRDVKKRFSRIDVLINNAGMASMNHLMLTPLKTLQNLLTTNVVGTFLFTREVAKVMQKNKYGRIVNFTTVAVPLRLEGEAVYGASKAAVENFTEVSSRELAEFGITVNAVGPTPVETDLIKNVPQDKINALLERQAVKRFGRFEDILNVINFFIHPDSSFVTGQILYLGGVNR